VGAHAAGFPDIVRIITVGTVASGAARARWASQPVWARRVLGAYLAGFADGTGAHVRDLARGGLHAYAFAPVTAQVFFVALVLLDPLVIVLVALARPAGVWLAAAVMAADIAVNWWVNWAALAARWSRFLSPAAGLLPITLFGLFVLISFVPLLRSRTRRDRALTRRDRACGLRKPGRSSARRKLSP
jgi:hypothetical protein